jgi:hypothetical protein
LQAFGRLERQVEAWRQGPHAVSSRAALLAQLRPRFQQLLQTLEEVPGADPEDGAEEAA